MRVAIVGATGLVGREMLQVLAEMHYPVTQLLPVASARSLGQHIAYDGKDWPVVLPAEALAQRPDVALFSAGGSVSKEWAPQFAQAGTVVIDNSSAWRMHPDVPLVVSEVNPQALHQPQPQWPGRLVANPNCSTMQMVVALQPLHVAYGLRRLVISTYQSVTGTGKAAVDQLNQEAQGLAPTAPVYPHPIHQNALPHIDVFMNNGYTREEMKLVHETRKILGLPQLPITATAVRIPTMGGHAESVNVELERDFDLPEVRALLAAAPGVVVQDDPAQNLYPMPRTAHRRNEVFVGRIRRDEGHPRTLNLWIVADNLRKGAATNAVQLAQLLRPVGA